MTADPPRTSPRYRAVHSETRSSSTLSLPNDASGHAAIVAQLFVLAVVLIAVLYVADLSPGCDRVWGASLLTILCREQLPFVSGFFFVARFVRSAGVPVALRHVYYLSCLRVAAFDRRNTIFLG